MKPETKTAQHTSGPWTLHDLDENNPGREWSIVTTGPIAYVTTEPSDTGISNARLIASAPELLSALELALATIERLAPSHRGFDSTRGTKDVICAAISKAKGDNS